MSIHYNTSPDVEEKLKKQKAASTVVSIFISLSAIALIAMILAALTILIPDENRSDESIAVIRPIIEMETKQVDPTYKPPRKTHVIPASSPAPPLSTLVALPNPVSIPTADTPSHIESLDFNAEPQFGIQPGFGVDNLGETEMFDGLSITGSRIAYVIDYSLSMKGKRDQLMRVELSNSISKLENGADYSLIFFAGPTWQASDQIVMMPDGRSIKTTIQEDGEKVSWNGSKHKIDAREFDKFQPNWIQPTAQNIEKSLQHIQSSPLALGTEWRKPLMKALEMTPQPDTIVFMTDGTSGANSAEAAREIGEIAKRKSVVINAIALLEPKAQEAMKIMAKETGGSAIMVNSVDDVVNLLTGEQVTR